MTHKFSTFWSVQATVSVFSEYYKSDRWFSTKKNAEQSAALVALEKLVELQPDPIDNRDSSNATNPTLHKNHAVIHASIEAYIKPQDGIIKRIKETKDVNVFQYDVRGRYRFCQNVQRQHKRNGILFLVNYTNMTYAQRCRDPKCSTYQSDWKPIIDGTS